jgi:prepilin-type N-terminal cleavage/methylation domain-containing protein
MKTQGPSPFRIRIRTDERGFTLVELLIVVAVLGVISAIAIGHLLRARIVANEASAVSSMRAVASGQATFASTCGNGYYQPVMANLVTNNYVSPDVALTQKSGYTFTLAAAAGATPGPADCDGNATRNDFYYTAAPMTVTTGRRAFATNFAATIWQDSTGVPPAEPFTASATVLPIDDHH